jgi:hypothetical protein
MPNIPRRKIYEELLKYEDILIEIQILLYNEENFQKYYEKFQKRIPELNEIFIKINSLLVLFFENKKFESEEEFKKELEELENNFNLKVIPHIKKNPNLQDRFKDLFDMIKDKIKNDENFNTYIKIKKIYEILDEYNHHIPKILQIRRDKMKKIN